MRWLLLVVCLACGSVARAQSTAPVDEGAESRARVPVLYQQWKAEHDPAKRADLAGQVVEAVIHCYANQPVDVAEDVMRDGLPRNEIAASAAATEIKLTPLTVLAGAQLDFDREPWASPIFRRIARDRVEAWTPVEGWLFDATGKLLADVKVPRRDGKGRDWFGAFLPDGTWITTDLWDNDEQLNCFSRTGEWKWDLPGKTIRARLAKPRDHPDDLNEPLVPAIGWVRADKTGKAWLVALGFDYTRGFARVGPRRQITPLPEDVKLWNEVYPRSMGVRGMYTDLFIDSDDAKANLAREEVSHGVGVGWPSYRLAEWNVVIREGTIEFGFLPHSHDVYVEGYQPVDEPRRNLPHRVIFFDAGGKYRGEVTGSWLGDTANGRGLLVQDAGHRVLDVVSDHSGLRVVKGRKFVWGGMDEVVPLAIYDDLRLGFFLRGPGLTVGEDRGREAQTHAEIVLARW